MTAEASTLIVNILGKEFPIACPAGEEEGLQEAAQLLNRRMGEIKDAGKVIGMERIAVIAALNIAHEFISAKDRVEGKDTTNLLKKLNKKLDNALQSAKQLEI